MIELGYELEDRKTAGNIGFYASWVRPININQLQIQAVVLAEQTILNFSS